EPHQLTTHTADDYEPHFSPDGTKIAFRSNRDGGGVYVVSSLGGDPVLLAKRGRRPRFSPDGQLVAYWTGSNWFAAGGLRTYIVPAAGGQPEFVAHGRAPVWLPDSRRLLYFVGLGSGSFSAGLGLPPGSYWLVASIDGQRPFDTGAFQHLEEAGLRSGVQGSVIEPGVWRGDSASVYFAARFGDSMNVWQIPFSTEGKATGPPAQVTFGTGTESGPCFAGDSRVFASGNENLDVWSVALDANRGKTQGEAERLTHDQADDVDPHVSEDGQRLAFLSSRRGMMEVWLMDLHSGETRPLGAVPNEVRQLTIARHTSRIAFSAGRTVKVAPFGGTPSLVTEDGGVVTDFSLDESLLLIRHSALNPDSKFSEIGALDAGTGRWSVILDDPERPVYDPRFSPDGKWIAFHKHQPDDRRQVLIAPFRGSELVGSDNWIPVTDGLRS
ncbi:MAG: hypothetical protein GY953_05355, partial [bacterium]|nr:hypothetical protein [bacterium]